ncbi:MAG: redoxin domain-containing protein [Opitutales bacterium]|nr:redoxin domain-containing protein [Opitutales bacterium]
MSLKVGDKAPLFKLKTKTPEGLAEVDISDNIGVRNTVLLFFPFAFTSVCTQELCSVSGGLDEYDEMDAAVYAVSVDSPFAQEAFARSSNIKVTLLSDFNKEVSALYGVQYTELLGMKGVAKRSAFVINKRGVITYAESSDDPTRLPDFERIRTAIKDS